MWRKEDTIKILALDLGTKTGWAIGAAHSTDRLYSGVQDFSLKRGESPGMRFLRFDRWISKVLANNEPDVVVYEMAHHRGGAATAVLNGMIGILLKVCAETKTEHTLVHSAQLKKYATGNGRAGKEEMMKEAERRFCKKILLDDEADALLMWEWARDEGL